MLAAGTPFVLLDDARQGGSRTLYRDPHAIVATRDPAEIRGCLVRIRAAAADGWHAAGWIAYDAGHALDARLAQLARSAAATEPWLLWFGLFATAQWLVPGELEHMLPDPAGAWAGAPRPLIERVAYDAAFARVSALIAAGDIYQANLSLRAAVRVHGHPLALCAAARGRARRLGRDRA